MKVKSFTLNFGKSFLAGAFFMASFGLSAQSNVFDDIIVPSDDHSYLEAAILQAGLEGALRTNPELTVFAPTNDAFDALAEALETDIAGLLALSNLADVLLYHVLGSEALSTSLSNGDIVQPLNLDNTLKVTIDGSNVFVNQAPVSGFDLTADNGVVHVLDAVVLPWETVADIAIGSPAHSILVNAVIEARLLPALTNPFAELTVFAPTNDAFVAALGELDLTADELLESDGLADILLYHVLGAEALSSSLSNGDIVQPLNLDNTLKVTIDGSNVFVNQAPVSGFDLTADNGVVHVLDAVVLPWETVADVAIGSPAHTTLVAAVVEARLLPALTNPFNELTVFAPTNDAFNTLASELDLSLADILALPSLTDILLYHVVDGTVLSTDLQNGSVPTLNGQSVTVDITSGVLINTSSVTAADIVADNGVVHVIDAVLVPGVFAGINEVAGNLNVTMYPNPATDNIRFDGVENGTFEVVNMYGSVVLSGELQNSEVSLSTIAEGTYVVRLINENGVFQGRLIKM